MRRIGHTLPVLLMIAFALTVPARADVIWEPLLNDFYAAHSAQCEREGRSYYANGPDGYVTFWNAPGGDTVMAQYENGTALYVHYLYRGWGCIHAALDEDNHSDCGWAPMEWMELIYDHISFEEEYGEQFRPYDGEFARCAGTPAVTFWAYPGAPEPHIVSEDSFIRDLGDSSTFYGSCWDSVFTDENGLTWGYMPYLRMGWICFDDPAGTQFPVRDIPVWS